MQSKGDKPANNKNKETGNIDMLDSLATAQQGGHKICFCPTHAPPPQHLNNSVACRISHHYLF